MYLCNKNLKETKTKTCQTEFIALKNASLFPFNGHLPLNATSLLYHYTVVIFLSLVACLMAACSQMISFSLCSRVF